MAEEAVKFERQQSYGSGTEFFGLFSVKIHITWPKDGEWGQVWVGSKEETSLRFDRIIPKDVVTESSGYKPGLWSLNGEYYTEDKNLVIRIKQLISEKYSVRRNTDDD